MFNVSKTTHSLYIHIELVYAATILYNNMFYVIKRAKWTSGYAVSGGLCLFNTVSNNDKKCVSYRHNFEIFFRKKELYIHDYAAHMCLVYDNLRPNTFIE